MEYEKKSVTLYSQEEIIHDQFMMDDDYNVPDAKYDVKKVLIANGVIHAEEMKRVENYIRIHGNMSFKVLVLCDETDVKMQALEGQIPFEEMVFVQDIDGKNVFLRNTEVELNVNLINSRKLNMKAMIELELGVEERKEETFISDISKEDSFCMKYEEKEFLDLILMKKDTYRIKEEISIGATKEAIATILWSEIASRKLDTKIVENALELRGELSLFCFYESSDHKIDWVLQTIPYEGKIELAGVEEGMYHQIYAALIDPVLDMRMDEDGEMRALGVEATLEARVVVYRECREKVMTDVYSTQKNCIPEYVELHVERPVLLNHSKCKVAEQISVPEMEKNILQICHSSARIEMEEVKHTEQGMIVEGILHLWFLYVKADDSSPFDVWQGMIPFSHLIENHEMTEEMTCELFPFVEQISIGFLGNAKIEVKAVLSFQCFFKQPFTFCGIIDLKEEELDWQLLRKQPSLIGYVVKEKDDLWEIAKKYKMTKEQIMEENNIENEILKEGEKLLIFRENIGIL